MKDVIKNFDFSDENIYIISKIVGNNTSKMSPSYFSKICATTGFLTFLIKDALEYAGVIIEKKTDPSRVYKNMIYQQGKEKELLEKFKSF